MRSYAQAFLKALSGHGKRTKVFSRPGLEPLEDRLVLANGYTQLRLFDPYSANPSTGRIFSLPNGNFVATAPGDSVNGINGAGGVYLYSSTGSLISAMTGSHTNDFVGSAGITVLSNGNFLVSSPVWNGGMGAVTWVDGFAGLSGAVSITNSLIGTSTSDGVGVPKPLLLTNGNYLVATPTWRQGDGAVTWGSSTTGVSGVISSDNSFVGDADHNDGTDSDKIGSFGVTALANGNYVISSPKWNHGAGAVTWGNGSGGSHGVVSVANSLIGGQSTDSVGGRNISGVVGLSNGNYVVISPLWNGQVGAVTWANGTAPTAAMVSPQNSLVGAVSGDQLGSTLFGALVYTPLSNGNLLIISQEWNNGKGAVTLVKAATGITGVVSAMNSLVGSSPGDRVGGTYQAGSAIALANGDFVVGSPSWNNNSGAVTWGDGEQGIVGAVSFANSLVGSPGDRIGSSITALINGNYVVASPNWNGGAGAVTWQHGADGAGKTVSATNSLTGNPGDSVGIGGVTPLTNGNYVVESYSWNQSAGAVTWGSGTGGTTGLVSAVNSLVGDPGDVIGSAGSSGSSYIMPLPNGNYLVRSPFWHQYAGAVTWGNGSGGTVGLVSPLNSIVGTRDDSSYSTYYYQSVIVLTNGNFLIVNPFWNHGTGAVTWGNGAIGTSGIVSSANSYVGDASLDSNQFGVPNGISAVALSNGNYVIDNIGWNRRAGAVTWGNGLSGFVGVATPGNSLVGSQDYEMVGAVTGVGAYGSGVTPLSNGNYVIASDFWNRGSGALTICSGTQATTGPITRSNSFVDVVPANYNTVTPVELGNGNFYSTNTYVYDNHGFGGGFPSNFPVLYTASDAPIIPPAQAYVLSVYDKLLGRPADSSGLQYWLGQLYGGTSRAAFVSFVNHTPEYFGTIIEAAYQRCLGRSADQAGVAYWTGRLSLGLRDELLEAALTGSPEFYQHAGGTDKTWVDALYQTLLGRSADSAGEEAWLQSLAHGADRGLVTYGFASSVERSTQRVTDLYSHYLGRTAGEPEVGYWVGQLRAGVSSEDIVTAFVSSDEFYQKHS